MLADFLDADIFSMARIARVVATGFPHHITQRGNRRQQTFFVMTTTQHILS